MKGKDDLGIRVSEHLEISGRRLEARSFGQPRPEASEPYPNPQTPNPKSLNPLGPQTPDALSLPAPHPKSPQRL